MFRDDIGTAEQKILMTLLSSAFTNQEDVIDEVHNMSQELISLLIKFYSNYCTKENKRLTNYVVNSQGATMVMNNHIKCLEMCLKDLDQRRKLEIDVTMNKRQKARMFIYRHQFLINGVILLWTIVVNILILTVTFQMLWNLSKFANFLKLKNF